MTSIEKNETPALSPSPSDERSLPEVEALPRALDLKLKKACREYALQDAIGKVASAVDLDTIDVSAVHDYMDLTAQNPPSLEEEPPSLELDEEIPEALRSNLDDDDDDDEEVGEIIEHPVDDSSQPPSVTVPPVVDEKQEEVSVFTVDSRLQKMRCIDTKSQSSTTSVKPPAQSGMGANMDLMNDELTKKFGARAVQKIGKHLEGLILLITGLRYDDKFEAIVTRCLLFLNGILDSGIIMGVQEILMAYIKNIDSPKLEQEKLEAQEIAGKNTPEASAIELWKALKQGIFTKHLSYVMGTVFAVATCKLSNVTFNHPLFDNMIKQSEATSFDAFDLVDHLCQLYNWCSTVGLACFTQGSLDPLRFNSDTLAVCHERFYFWQNRFVELKRETNPDPAERTQMYIEMEEVVKNLQSFVKYDRDKFMTPMSSTLLRDASALYQDIRDYISQVDFVRAAFGLHIWGVPKVGKSTIMGAISEQVCLSGGEIYDPKRVANLNLTAPFQDEISNSTQTVQMNETIPVKEHLSKNAEIAYTTALAISDNIPWHPNRSNLEDKARIILRILLAMSTGNTECPWLNIAKSIAAWLRRYMLIKMEVRPEFADSYGRLDSDKLDGSNDYHKFHFYEMVIHEDGSTSRDTFVVNGMECKDINTEELLEAIRVVSLRHFRQQEALEKSRKEKGPPGCLVCRRLARHCICKQGIPESTEPEHIDIRVVSEVVEAPKPDDDDDEFDGRPASRENHSYRKKFQRGKPWRGRKNPKKNKPEAGLATMVVSSTAGIAWDLMSVWLNPFVKFGHLWSIDKSTANLIREELIAELEWIPTTVGTTGLSLVPSAWCQRRDGSLTLFGKAKDYYARAVAAEYQIFLPLTYLFKRAFTIGFVVFFLTLLLQSIFIWAEGPEVMTYHQTTVTKINRTAWQSAPFFPEYVDVKMYGKIVASDGYWGTRVQDSDVDLIMSWQYLMFFVPLSLVVNFCLPFIVLFSGNSSIPIIRNLHDELVRDMNWLGSNAHPYYLTQMFLGKLHYWGYLTREVEIRTFKVTTLSWWEVPLALSFAVFVLGFLSMWHRRAIGCHRRYQAICERIKPDDKLQSDLYDRMKRNAHEFNAFIPTAIGLVGLLATALSLYNTMRHDNEPQAGTVVEKKKSWNDWFTFSSYVAPSPHTLAGRTSVENANAIRRNLVIIKATIGSTPRVVRGMYMESGVLMLPRHFFKEDMFGETMVEHADCTLECNNYVHTARLWSKSAVRIDDKDALLVQVPTGPKVKNQAKESLPTASGTGHWRGIFIRKNGPTDYSHITVNAQYEDNIDCGGFSVGRGVKYSTLENFSGLCGSPVIADRKDGAILGFHIAGSPGTNPAERFGYAQEIMYESYLKAKELLSASASVLNVPEACEQDTERYGRGRVCLPGPLPAATFFQEKKVLPGVEILGHDPQLSTARSRGVQSLLSTAIATHCGVPNTWKAVDLSKPWVDHNRALEANIRSVLDPDPAAIRWAVDDYIEPLIPALQKFKAEREYIRVLNVDESLNGIPNANYMGAINTLSSMGIPYNLPKWMVLLKLEPYPDGRTRWGLTPELLVEYERMKHAFLHGLQYDVWGKTCLKDEIVAEDKEKVRLFFITQAIFTILVRQYMLGICEFLSCNSILSECMVGMNCAGPDWAELCNHISSIEPSDEMESDSDYKDYDLRRSQAVMCAMLKINRRLCESIGYTEDDLKILDGIFDCLRNPVLNWNGTHLRMFLWSSGNSFTVYGNSMENSLYMRISFYLNGLRVLGSKKFHALGPYRKNEALACYGDDNKNKSRLEARAITCFSAKKWFFDSIGMVITDARKSATPPEFVHSSEIDFLKRKSVFHEALGTTVGALDKHSIYKMGHSAMKSAHVELEDLAVQSYNSMMFEAFLHGEEFHETLRSQLKLVADETKISSPQLDVSYQDRVLEWHRKYSRT